MGKKKRLDPDDYELIGEAVEDEDEYLGTSDQLTELHGIYLDTPLQRKEELEGELQKTKNAQDGINLLLQ